jgi:hypothetical protein
MRTFCVPNSPNLKDHPLSSVPGCLFNIFSYPPSLTCGCAMSWWQGTHLIWVSTCKLTHNNNNNNNIIIIIMLLLYFLINKTVSLYSWNELRSASWLTAGAVVYIDPKMLHDHTNPGIKKIKTLPNYDLKCSGSKDNRLEISAMLIYTTWYFNHILDAWWKWSIKITACSKKKNKEEILIYYNVHMELSSEYSDRLIEPVLCSTSYD